MLKTKVARVECINGEWVRFDTGTPISGGVVYQEVSASGAPVVDLEKSSKGFMKLIYWIGVATREASDPPDSVPEKPVSAYTDAEIAADPIYLVVQRIIKAARTFGPTSKRPTTLTVEDKGFRYWNTERKAPEYWNGSKWFDAMGTALT